MLAASDFLKDASGLDLLLESFKSLLERLSFFDDNSRHANSTPSHDVHNRLILGPKRCLSAELRASYGMRQQKQALIEGSGMDRGCPSRSMNRVA